MLIDYISVSFPLLAKSQHLDAVIIIDSQTYGETPIQFESGQSTPLFARKNNKGEANCGVWFHAACSLCDTIVIHAGDTDVFMYGLALYEQGHFQHKKVFVEREKGVEYVSIHQGCAILSQLPELSELVTKKQAWPSLLAVYLLSGSDYISGFFRISHDFMVKVFLKYLRDIISDETLIKTDQSGKFMGLSENTVIRFISFVYLEKHIKLFSHLYSDAAQLKHALLISKDAFSPNVKTLLSWLQYDLSSCNISTESQFNDFVRRICFFKGSTSQDLFKTIMPSGSALSLHSLSGSYVLQLAMESVVPDTQIYKQCNGGWTSENGTVAIKWESDIENIKRS